MSDKKPSILFIAAWWPRDDSPYEGLFIREHALSVASDLDLHIVHLRFHKVHSGLFPRTNIHMDIKDEGRVYLVDVYSRVRRFGVHNWLVKRAFDRVIANIMGAADVGGVHLNVRDHLTRLVPELEVLKNVPFVHSEHFSYYHRGIYLKSEAEQLLEFKRIRKWFNDPRLKSLMPVSRELAEILSVKYHAPTDKIHVIPNIASDQFFYERMDERGLIRIVAAASWSGPKRPMMLMKAMADLPPALLEKIELTIIGEGEYFNEMKNLAAELSDKYRIQLTGFLPKDKLAKIVRSATFFVHPTGQENAPTVISEALCCGVPVVSMRVNGIPEMVDDTNGVLVPPGQQAALTEVLLWMCGNHQNFDRAAIAHRAIELYGMETVRVKLLNEIRKML